MYGTSRSRAVHSFNSLNFFPIAKSLWGCGGKAASPRGGEQQSLWIYSQDSEASAPGLSVSDRPKMCGS